MLIHWKKGFFGNAYQTVCVLIHQRLFNHFDVRECNRRSQQTLYIFLTIIYHIFKRMQSEVPADSVFFSHCDITYIYVSSCHKFNHIYTFRDPKKPCIFLLCLLVSFIFLLREWTTRVIKDTRAMFFYFLFIAFFCIFFHINQGFWSVLTFSSFMHWLYFVKQIEASLIDE